MDNIFWSGTAHYITIFRKQMTKLKLEKVYNFQYKLNTIKLYTKSKCLTNNLHVILYEAKQEVYSLKTAKFLATFYIKVGFLVEKNHNILHEINKKQFGSKVILLIFGVDWLLNQQLPQIFGAYIKI